jgi:phosphoribosylformylglycinamidine synthase
MADKAPNLYDAYLIDGVPQALTPAGLLQECTLPGALPPSGTAGSVADETVDIAPAPSGFRDDALESYADAVASLPRPPFPLPFAGPVTCARVAKALVDAIWMGGHFRLGDLTLKAEWRWNDGAIGNQAAFYASVGAAAEYIDAIGLKISEVKVSCGACNVAFKATTTPEEEAPDEEDSLIRELPFRTANPRISRRRRCPATIQAEASDWLIYIPLDTCDYRLGGSLLAAATGASRGSAPEVGDADYFIDGYEVIRELVEDGIVKAGATVLEGGLMNTLRSMSAVNGAEISVNDICRAYGGEMQVRVLFAEVPGVVLQIADIDYDYVDAELLLQDIAYFPLGHPVPGTPGVSVLSGGNSLTGILESLMNSLEGED